MRECERHSRGSGEECRRRCGRARERIGGSAEECHRKHGDARNRIRGRAEQCYQKRGGAKDGIGGGGEECRRKRGSARDKIDAGKDAKWKSAYAATSRDYQDLDDRGLRRSEFVARIAANVPRGSVRSGFRREQDIASGEQARLWDSIERANPGAGKWKRKGEWC